MSDETEKTTPMLADEGQDDASVASTERKNAAMILGKNPDELTPADMKRAKEIERQRQDESRSQKAERDAAGEKIEREKSERLEAEKLEEETAKRRRDERPSPDAVSSSPAGGPGGGAGLEPRDEAPAYRNEYVEERAAGTGGGGGGGGGGGDDSITQGQGSEQAGEDDQNHIREAAEKKGDERAEGRAWAAQAKEKLSTKEGQGQAQTEGNSSGPTEKEKGKGRAA